MRFILRLFGLLTAHAVDHQQRKEFFLFLRRPNAALNLVTRLQVEPTDLRRRNINVFRARQIIIMRTAQETKAFG